MSCCRITVAISSTEDDSESMVGILCSRNIASARSIQKNGGVLENELDDGGTMIQRYWIDLNERKNA